MTDTPTVLDRRRSVVITGGGTGIGLAAARTFAAAGHAVTITGRRRDRLDAAAAELGTTVTPVDFDAADPDAVAAALHRLPGTVDVLVNAAGGIPSTSTAATVPGAPSNRTPSSAGDLTAVADTWRATFATNMLTAVLVTTALEPRLADDARIVSVGSIAARQGSGAYGASKAALESWTASVAARLGARGITANVVSPGVTLDTEFFGDRLTEERRARLIGATMTGRAGTPADVAATIEFLASPSAGHVTGQVLNVNGGAQLGR